MALLQVLIQRPGLLRSCGWIVFSRTSKLWLAQAGERGKSREYQTSAGFMGPAQKWSISLAFHQPELSYRAEKKGRVDWMSVLKELVLSLFHITQERQYNWEGKMRSWLQGLREKKNKTQHLSARLRTSSTSSWPMRALLKHDIEEKKGEWLPSIACMFQHLRDSALEWKPMSCSDPGTLMLPFVYLNRSFRHA